MTTPADPEQVLDTFRSHGVTFKGRSGDEHYGDSPFTDKPNKLYVNPKKAVFHDKSSGHAGSVPQFLQLMSAKVYEPALSIQMLQSLATDRRLPLAAFSSWRIGWDSTRQAFTLPTIGPTGRFTNIYRYSLTRQRIVMPTKGRQAGLFGGHFLAARGSEIYLCEGPWDAIALNWLRMRVKMTGAVVAVPGAGTFKKEWLPWFSGRSVNVMYDNDEPGDRGQQIVSTRLAGVAKQVRFLHWPEPTEVKK